MGQTAEKGLILGADGLPLSAESEAAPGEKSGVSPATAAAEGEASAEAAKNPLERRVDYVFAAAEVETMVDEVVMTRGKSLKLKGFRPGKAPLSVLRRHFGREALQRVLGEKAQTRFKEEMNEKAERLAAPPAVAAHPHRHDDGYQVSCYYEVLPEIAAADFSAVQLKVPVLPVGEAQVDEMIEILREQQGRYIPYDGKAESGHRLTVDYKTFVAGNETPVNSGEDRHLLLGKLPDELEKALMGAAVGDVVKVDRTEKVAAESGGDGAATEEKMITMAMTVKAVDALEKAELNEELFKQLGVEEGGLPKFRETVEAHLKKEVALRLRNLRQKRAFDTLQAATPPFALPQTMLYRECQTLWHSLQRQVGGDPKKPAPTKPEELNMFVPEAGRRVMLGLILSEWQRQHQPEISDAELQSRLDDIARDYELPDEKKQQMRADAQQMEAVRLSVLEDKITDWVCAQAPCEDETVELAHLLRDPAATGA